MISLLIRFYCSRAERHRAMAAALHGQNLKEGLYDKEKLSDDELWRLVVTERSSIEHSRIAARYQKKINGWQKRKDGAARCVRRVTGRKAPPGN